MSSRRIGETLRSARGRRGWSRDALAYHSGVSASAIAQIESGRRREVRLSTLAALAGALRVSIDYLIGSEAAMGSPVFEHHVLAYDSDEDFLAAAVPFLAEGIERSEALLAVTTQANIELLRGIGAVGHEIRSHGGGARSSVWNQIKADVCCLPVVTLHGAEAAVRGDALLAGVSSGAFRDLSQACQATLRFAARFEPDATTRSAYETAYMRYIQLFDTVRPLFRWADESVAATDDTNQPAPVGHDPGRM